MKPRIAMLYCYFGKWPSYFNLFLKTCSYNPEIDFIFFSDSPPPEGNIYSNTKYHLFTLNEFNALATERLGFKVNVMRPYKLCDFKPAYGCIFQDYIKEYDFWGFGDIDIILGNVENFISNEMLTAYDIISVRKEYISGFFSIFRNTENINALFTKSRDYKVVFQNQQNYCFDECNYAFPALWSGRSILDIQTEIQSMTEIVVREQQDHGLRVHMGTIVDEDFGNYLWEKGRICDTQNDKEFLLLHLIRHKEHPLFRFPNWKTVPDSFYVNSFGFHRNSKGIRFYLKDILMKVDFLFTILLGAFRIYFNMYFIPFNKFRKINLSHYVGTFQLGPSTITIDLVDGRLICEGFDKRLPIKPFSKKLFGTVNYPYVFEFKLDRNGSAESMRLLMMPSISVYSFNRIRNKSLDPPVS